MAKDPTLMAYSPDLADVLVVPANGQGPTQGPGEAIEEGYVPGELAGSRRLPPGELIPSTG
jgi:hypothetical protein